MRALAQVLLTMLFTLAPACLSAQERAAVSTDRLNVRATASVEAAIIMTLSKGAVVAVIERQDAWTRITSGSKSGWVRSTSLVAVPATSVGAAPSPSAAAQPRERSDPARTESADATATRQPVAPPAKGGYGSFEQGSWYGGPRIWLGSVLGGAIPIGGQVEYAYSRPGEYGPGIVGFALSLDYYSYKYASYNLVTGAPTTESFSIIPVTAFANYHFPLEDKRIDPYLGAGLGMFFGGYYGNIGGSAIFPFTQAGVRYFVGPRLAVQANAGVGFGTLSVGATWKQ